MLYYKAPVEHGLFLLNDVLAFHQREDLAGLCDITADITGDILEAGANFAVKQLLPLNASGDLQGCKRTMEGDISTPDGFKEAYKAYSEAGWGKLTAPPEFGGQGLPHSIAYLVNEYMSAANMAFTMYPGLTSTAISALEKHASEELKKLFLPSLIAGNWSGTMNLTEPHCGTDLGLIKMRAEADEHGAYTLTGGKIFISSGEHDLSENIIHLVLARLKGAPEGTKGISMFAVPKYLPDNMAHPLAGSRNSVVCAGIEEKMGIHANATCQMNYDAATGWLVGQENNGLKAMFTMMNEARLSVAMQGLALSELAYQNAAQYAGERLQGRALGGAKYPEKPADPLIVHPDIRRELLMIKAFNEGARALLLWTSIEGDLARFSADKAVRQRGEDLMGLMTPVLKGVLTDRGFSHCVRAQQVLGGYGYIRDWGMEQIVRDARIAMIYEGANGIQALDLVGRKLPRDRGRAVSLFLTEIKRFIESQSDKTGYNEFVQPLAAARDTLQAALQWLMQNAFADPNQAGAGAYDFMHLMGLVGVQFMWSKIAMVVLDGMGQAAQARQAWLQGRLDLARVFAARNLPECEMHLARIRSGAAILMKPDVASFNQ